MDQHTDPNISLNRLFFLPEGKLDNNSPYFVIEFVAKSLGIKFDFESNNWKNEPSTLIAYINDILQNDTFIFLSDIDSKLPEIALFINPEISVQWKRKNLLEAFWSIYNFTPKIPLKSNESFGYKTESTPYNIDPIMVYQIAYHYGIPVSRETTIDKIQKEICNYSMKLTPLRQSILSKIREVIMNKNRRGLIDIKSYLSESPTAGRVNFPDKYPKTNIEAIFRAAKEYRWDIEMSSDPIREYIELDRVSDDSYSPIDHLWRKIFDVNRKYFHLDFRYMSKYDSLYTDSVKKGLIYLNGNSTRSEYLVLGMHPINPRAQDIKECRTIINYDKIPSDHIERYRKLISTYQFVCSREELFSLWDSKKCFVSPLDFSIEFSDSQLDMIRINSDPNDELRLLIENIKNNTLEIIDKSFEECRNIENSKLLFKKLMNIGMYIRGYKICYTEYPLSESFYDIDLYQSKIEEKVILKIKNLIDLSVDFFDKIPVFTGRNLLGEESSEYNIRLYGDNKTIGDIIRRILNPDEIEGCIRTNSNFILITSWYYLTNFYNDIPFKISDLKFIS